MCGRPGSAVLRQRAPREAYRRDAGAFFIWCAEFRIDPLAAAPLHADGFRQYTAGVLKKKASRARRLAVVSLFYRFARRRHPELRLDNPFDGVARPRTSRTSATVGLSMEQAVTCSSTPSGPDRART